MLNIKKSLAYLTAISVAVGGLVVAGAPAASAATGPVDPGEESSGGIGFPVFGIIAIAGIATVAIWQGINDSKKKEEAQIEEEKELQEQEEFEEYFDFGTPEPDAGESANPDSAAAPVETAAATGE